MFRPSVNVPVLSPMLLRPLSSFAPLLLPLCLLVSTGGPALADGGSSTPTCVYEVGGPFTALPGPASPECTNVRAMYVHNDGSFTSGGGGSTTFPYSGTVNGQTATTASFLGAGGLYNTTAPTLTNGQFAPLQQDVNGNLKTTVANTAFGINGSLPAGTNAIGSVTVTNTVATTDTNGGAQGTGATYNPPTGGSGFLGFLSGIFADLNRETFNAGALNVHNDGSFTSGGGATPSGVLGYITTAGQNALCATACTVTGYQQLGTSAEPNTVTGNFFDSTSATPTGNGVGFIGPLGVGQAYTFPATFKSTTALEVVMANAPVNPIIVYGHTP